MGELHFVLLLPTITNILNKGMARLLTLGPIRWKMLATNATGGLAHKRRLAWRSCGCLEGGRFRRNSCPASVLIPTSVLRGISKVRKVGHRTQPFGIRFQLGEPFA